jgi:hypothetical protein
MTRLTTARSWLTAAALTTTALLAWSGPASAAAVVYETQPVTALGRGRVGLRRQRATIDIPTGYDRYRRSWHKVEWVESIRRTPVAITLDLDPRHRTQGSVFRERDRLAASGHDYRELEFSAYERGGRLLVRWIYTLKDPGNDGPTAFVTVYLTGRHDRLTVAGWDRDRDLAKQVRHHVLHTLHVD